MANGNKKKIIRQFIGNESGAIAVMFALMLPVIMGFVGLGIDAGMWFKERRNMQTATDAAAVSAAIERTFGATTAEMTAIAKTEATRHGFVDGVDVLTLNPDFVHKGTAGHVEVTIVHPLDTFLSQIISNIVPQSTTRAVATTTGDANACVLALAPTGTGISVGNAEVNMTGCGVFANSDGTAQPNQSIKVGNGNLNVDCLWSHGTIDATIGTVSDPVANQNIEISDTCTVAEGVSSISDPFENLAVPTYAGCQTANLDIAGSTLSNAGGSGNLTAPTVICGNINLTSSDTLNVDPGVYVIVSGDLDIAGGATLNAPGVTFILTDGGVKINGTSEVNWSAPTLNDYSLLVDASADGNGNYMGQDYTNYTGIALFQSSATGGGTTRDVDLTGGADAFMSGAIYSPNNSVSFGGNSTAMPSDCLQIVGQTVTLNGNAALNNTCTAYGGNPVNYGAKPGLVE